MVGHLLEYHPAVLKLREMIASGELGKINYIYSNRLNFGKVRTEENALWSFAPHDVAVILRLMGQAPVEVLRMWWILPDQWNCRYHHVQPEVRK
jgi:UDP-2-acetamido-3-amino-2,3-dideoxy-glucuronate N-acetyltransferase